MRVDGNKLFDALDSLGNGGKVGLAINVFQKENYKIVGDRIFLIILFSYWSLTFFFLKYLRKIFVLKSNHLLIYLPCYFLMT